jgi:hypothetical protein
VGVDIGDCRLHPGEQASLVGQAGQGGLYTRLVVHDEPGSAFRAGQDLGCGHLWLLSRIRHPWSVSGLSGGSGTTGADRVGTSGSTVQLASMQSRSAVGEPGWAT